MLNIPFDLTQTSLCDSGERKLINTNGKLVDYHEEFVLILSSRNPNIKIDKSTSAYVNLINFDVTNAGLTEQLITSAIKQENPSLEERRRELLREHEEYREKLDDFQNKLLEDLANSAGDILENEVSTNNTDWFYQVWFLKAHKTVETQSEVYAFHICIYNIVLGADHVLERGEVWYWLYTMVMYVRCLCAANTDKHRPSRTNATEDETKNY